MSKISMPSVCYRYATLVCYRYSMRKTSNGFFCWRIDPFQIGSFKLGYFERSPRTNLKHERKTVEVERCVKLNIKMVQEKTPFIIIFFKNHTKEEIYKIKREILRKNYGVGTKGPITKHSNTKRPITKRPITKRPKRKTPNNKTPKNKTPNNKTPKTKRPNTNAQ